MSENPKKLKLDQLLDLKRAEKPAHEFWDGFQKEFRQRQLQTLIEKDSAWIRIGRLFLARSSILVPLSGAAVVLFVLVANFQENSPLRSEYDAAATLIQAAPQPVYVEVTVEPPAVEESTDLVPNTPISSPARASFVMDLIPNDEPESISYTREFPTSTIPAENRAVSALVSYTIARDIPAFGMTGRPQPIGF